MKKACMTGLILLVVFMFGCAGSLAIKQSTSTPAAIEIGGDGVIVVEFTGPVDNVASVTATVEEAPEIYYSLNNDGKNGDEKAGDKFWSGTANVPYEAQPGEYHLSISARDKEGVEILLKKEKNEEKGRRSVISVTVK